MSQYKKLLDNIDELQGLGFKSEVDIQPYLLSEDEVAKKLLLAKSPNMSKEDANMIVDSAEKSLADLESDDEFNKLTPSEKEEKREQTKEIKRLYRDKIAELKEHAKRILKEIKMAFYNLVREVKILVKKAITSLIQTSSAIAAIVVVIAAPPWNTPLAISYTMNVVDLLLTLISQMKNIIQFTAAFDKLHFVMNGRSLSNVCTIINANIEIVLGLWEKITGLDTLISNLLKKILDLLSNKERVFRKATRKLRKLGHFRNNDTYNIDDFIVKADNEEDASEAKDILDIFVVDYEASRVVDYKNKIDESAIKNMSAQVDRDKEIITFSEFEGENLYDIKLPNGDLLLEQTEDELEQLKKIYTVVIGQVKDATKLS